MRSSIKQLETLGFLRIVRERSTAGRYVRSKWFVSDSPIDDWAPYLQNQAVGEPAVVQPVAANQTGTNTEVLKTQKNSNTTTARSKPPASAVPLEIVDDSDKEIWLWLCQKLSVDPDTAQQDCTGLNSKTAIDVFTEVFECQRQGVIKTTVSQFMSSLQRKAREGKFKLSAGLALRAEIPEILRRQRVIQMALQVVPTFTSKDVPVGSVPPNERKKLRQLRDEIVEQGSVNRLAGLQR